MSPDGVAASRRLLGSPLADAAALRLGERATPRRAAGHHGVVRVPRRLPAAHALRVKRDLGDGYELDDDRGRLDREAVHAYSAVRRTGRKGGRGSGRTS